MAPIIIPRLIRAVRAMRPAASRKLTSTMADAVRRRQRAVDAPDRRAHGDDHRGDDQAAAGEVLGDLDLRRRPLDRAGHRVRPSPRPACRRCSGRSWPGRPVVGVGLAGRGRSSSWPSCAGGLPLRRQLGLVLAHLLVVAEPHLDHVAGDGEQEEDDHEDRLGAQPPVDAASRARGTRRSRARARCHGRCCRQVVLWCWAGTSRDSRRFRHLVVTELVNAYTM